MSFSGLFEQTKHTGKLWQSSLTGVFFLNSTLYYYLKTDLLLKDAETNQCCCFSYLNSFKKHVFIIIVLGHMCGGQSSFVGLTILFTVMWVSGMALRVVLLVWCCGLDENGSHRLTCLNTWSPVYWKMWLCWREQVTAGVFEVSKDILSQYFLSSVCGSRCELSALPVAMPPTWTLT